MDYTINNKKFIEFLPLRNRDENMKNEYPLKIIQKSSLNYNYQTIKITKSRIDKGLIAIPRSLLDWFP